MSSTTRLTRASWRRQRDKTSVLNLDIFRGSFMDFYICALTESTDYPFMVSRYLQRLDAQEMFCYSHPCTHGLLSLSEASNHNFKCAVTGLFLLDSCVVMSC